MWFLYTKVQFSQVLCDFFIIILFQVFTQNSFGRGAVSAYGDALRKNKSVGNMLFDLAVG